MAVTWVGLSSGSSGTGAINIQTHSGTQIGDTGLLMVTSANQTIATPTGDSGTWYPLGEQQGTGPAGSAGGVRIALFTITFTKAYASGNVPCTVADTGDFQYGRIVVMRGFMGIEAVAGSVVTPANGTCTFPAISTTMPGATIVNICATDEDYSGDMASKFGTPTNANLTDAYEWATMSFSTGTGGGILWIDWTQTNAGDTGQTTITHTTSQVFACITLAVNEHVQTAKPLSQSTHHTTTPRRAIGKQMFQIINLMTGAFKANAKRINQRIVRIAGIKKSITNIVSQRITKLSGIRKSVGNIVSQRATNLSGMIHTLQQNAQQYLKTLTTAIKEVSPVRKVINVARSSIVHITLKPFKRCLHTTADRITGLTGNKRAVLKMIIKRVTLLSVPHVYKGIIKRLSQIVDHIPKPLKAITKTFAVVRITKLSGIRKAITNIVSQRITKLSLVRKAIGNIVSQRITKLSGIRKAIGNIVSQRITKLSGIRKTIGNIVSQRITLKPLSALRNIVKRLSFIIHGSTSAFKQTNKRFSQTLHSVSSFVTTWLTGITQYTKTLTTGITKLPGIRKSVGNNVNQRLTRLSLVRKAITNIVSQRMTRVSGIRKAITNIVSQRITKLSGIRKTITNIVSQRMTRVSGIRKAITSIVSQRMTRVSGIRKAIDKKTVFIVKIKPIGILRQSTRLITQSIKNHSSRILSVGRNLKSGIRTSDTIKKASNRILTANSVIKENTAKLTDKLASSVLKVRTFLVWGGEIASVIFAKVGGVWKTVAKMYTKIDGAWRSSQPSKKDGDNTWLK